MRSPNLKYFLWFARIFSALLIAFFLFMFIGESFFSPESVNSKPLSGQDILALSLMGFCLIGLALAWKWELPGGALALIAFAVLALIHPHILRPSLLSLYPLNAVFFVIYGAFLNRKKEKIN
jgi:hypothetical protein